MRILLLWFPHIANVDLPRKICYVTPCLLFLEDQLWFFVPFFLLNSYHFIVIVEAEEPLEIFPICLKHSELEDDKCAILIDFLGPIFGRVDVPNSDRGQRRADIWPQKVP